MKIEDNPKYHGNSNYGKPKIEYINSLRSMDVDTLLTEIKDKIWLSAYANNNPRSDYHWQCDACHDVCVERFGNADLYQQAWNYVAKQ